MIVEHIPDKHSFPVWRHHSNYRVTNRTWSIWLFNPLYSFRHQYIAWRLRYGQVPIHLIARTAAPVFRRLMRHMVILKLRSRLIFLLKIKVLWEVLILIFNWDPWLIAMRVKVTLFVGGNYLMRLWLLLITKMRRQLLLPEIQQQRLSVWMLCSSSTKLITQPKLFGRGNQFWRRGDGNFLCSEPRSNQKDHATDGCS